MTIYLNSAECGLPSPATYRRMREHLRLEEERGTLDAAAAVAPESDRVRHDLAALVGATPDRIGFSWTTSSAWLAAVCRLAIAGKRLLVAPHEWGPNLMVLEKLADESGARIETLPALAFPDADPQSWAPLIDDDVAAIFVPMVTSVSGHRYPVEAIGALPRPESCRLVVDAAQAIGRVQVDVDAVNCDFLVATCRKWLRGPRGTAMFWTAPRAAEAFPVTVIEPHIVDTPSRLALGAAIGETTEIGVDEIGRRIGEMVRHGWQRAGELGLETLTGTPPETGTLCLAIPAVVAKRIQDLAAERDIQVRWPNPDISEPRAGDRIRDHGALRISPHVDNTMADMDALFDVIKTALN